MIVIRTSPWHGTFRKTLDTLFSMKDCCDEIWLGVYGYYSIEEQEKRAEYLKDIVKEIKYAGIRPIMEFGSNLGHVPEAPVTEITRNFEKMVGLNGKEATGAFCPRGKNFLAYEKKVAQIFSKIHPVGMYIDDDLRIEFRNIVGVGCFCDNCIKKFNEKYGYNFTREDLKKRFVYDIDVRKNYVAHNNQAMRDYAYMMTKEMANENPGINAGWENCFLGAFNGENFQYVFDGMHEATTGEIMSRSGAFVYNDHCPRNILDKVLNTSYQNSILPKFVTVRRPEIENTDFFALGKSIQGTCDEATLNMALGCNGVSFHCVGAGIEPMEYRKRMLRAFGDHRDYWLKMKELNKNTGVSGMSPAYFGDVYIAKHKDEKDIENVQDVSEGDTWWWANPPKERGRELFQIGMPLSYEKNKCNAFLLHPDMVPYFSDEDIRKLLASNCLTDGRSLMLLEERGFGDYLPVCATQTGGQHFEVYTDDEINGDVTGQVGMTDQFVPATFQRFTLKKGGSWRIISKKSVYPELGVTEFAEKPETVTSAVFETALGGKWGVIGTSMWSTLINTTKRTAILRLCDYLTGGLPAYINESEQVAVVPRTDEKGRFVYALLQSVSIGDTGNITLTVRKPIGENFTMSMPGNKNIEIKYTKSGDDYLLQIPPLRGWHNAIVISK